MLRTRRKNLRKSQDTLYQVACGRLTSASSLSRASSLSISRITLVASCRCRPPSRTCATAARCLPSSLLRSTSALFAREDPTVTAAGISTVADVVCPTADGACPCFSTTLGPWPPRVLPPAAEIAAIVVSSSHLSGSDVVRLSVSSIAAVTLVGGGHSRLVGSASPRAGRSSPPSRATMAGTIRSRSAKRDSCTCRRVRTCSRQDRSRLSLLWWRSASRAARSTWLVS